MNRADVEAILFRFAAAYPHAAAPQPGTVEEWTLSVESVSMATAMAAVDRWKASQDWPPTINQFLDTAHAVAAERRAAEHAARAPKRPAAIEGAPGTSIAAVLLRASRKALESFPDEKRRHVRCRSGECQACAAKDEVEAAIAEAVAAAFAELGIEPDAGIGSDALCSECGGDGGDGWVLDASDPHGRAYVRPCRTCNPALWELWRGGHLDADHQECPECKPTAKKRPALKGDDSRQQTFTQPPSRRDLD